MTHLTSEGFSSSAASGLEWQRNLRQQNRRAEVPSNSGVKERETILVFIYGMITGKGLRDDMSTLSGSCVAAGIPRTDPELKPDLAK